MESINRIFQVNRASKATKLTPKIVIPVLVLTNIVAVVGFITSLGIILGGVFSILMSILILYCIKVFSDESTIHLEDKTYKTSITNKKEQILLKDLNKVIEYGGDSAKGEIGEIRRLYTVLEVNEFGELFTTKQVIQLTEKDKYKEDLCQDLELTLNGWNTLRETFLLLSEDKSLRNKLLRAKKEIEEERIEIRKEAKNKQKYIEEYKAKYGDRKLPIKIVEEQERLEKDLEELGNRLVSIREDLKNIHFSEDDNIKESKDILQLPESGGIKLPKKDENTQLEKEKIKVQK